MKHWVFDLDGTLVDSISHYEQALAEVFDRHEVAFTPAHLRMGLEIGALETLRVHLGSDVAKRSMDWFRQRNNDDACRIAAFAGINELLAELQTHGATLSMWTGRDLESAEIILKSSGLDRFFEIRVSGTCVINNKPNAEGLQKIMELRGSDPGHCVMIGDHEHDMMAARNVGVYGVRATWSPHWNIHSHGPCALAQKQFASVEEFAGWARTLMN